MTDYKDVELLALRKKVNELEIKVKKLESTTPAVYQQIPYWLNPDFKMPNAT